MVTELLRRGYQSRLPIDWKYIDPINRQQKEEAHKRKIGLLVRILSGKRIGSLYNDIRLIESNVKAGGLRLTGYTYDTKEGRQMVLAEPEDIKEVIGIWKDRKLGSLYKND